MKVLGGIVIALSVLGGVGIVLLSPVPLLAFGSAIGVGVAGVLGGIVFIAFGAGLDDLSAIRSHLADMAEAARRAAAGRQ